MFNFNNKDVCPCLSCEHSNVCMYREKFALYYDKINSENRDSNIPECATLSVSCRYARFSSLSASCASRGSNMIQGVADKDTTLCAVNKTVDGGSYTINTSSSPYTIDTSSQCKIS